MGASTKQRQDFLDKMLQESISPYNPGMSMKKSKDKDLEELDYG